MTRFGDVAEEGPGRLQSSDHLIQLMAVGGPHETVPGVGQNHQQGPYRAPAAGLPIVDEAQPPEVQFGHFPRAVLSHANRRRLASLPVATPEPPVPGRIGYPTPPRRQQLLDAGDLQLILGEPPVDLIRPRGQQFLAGCLRDTGTRAGRRRQHVELVLGGRSFLLGPPPRLPGSRQIHPHSFLAQPRTCDYLPLAIPRLPAPDHFLPDHFLPDHFLYVISTLCTLYAIAAPPVQVRPWAPVWRPMWPNGSGYLHREYLGERADVEHVRIWHLAATLWKLRWTAPWYCRW